jgi:hypothetical protein
MSNIFLVTSCIKSLIGKINHEDRYEQTLKTFDSVRSRAKDSIIVFCDSSVGGLEEDKKETISSKVDHFLDYSVDPTAQQINQQGLKSIGESYLLRSSIIYAKNNLDLSKDGRMFKLGGRCELLDDFTIDDYKDTKDKFVFKKRLNSWMGENIQKAFGSTHILETRLYSWSFSLVDEYLSVLEKNMQLMSRGLDTEHSHFLNIPKDKLLEFDKLNVGCFVAAGAYYIMD